MKSPEVRTSKHCDAFILGAGPAGLAASIALRQRGLDVVVADSLVPPIDKACGEGLMPDSRRELASLGITLCADDGREFSGIHFANRNPGREDLATAEFPHGQGIGIRRVDLHQRLIDRAREIGVQLNWGVHADFSNGVDVKMDGKIYRYRYLVGADGESSRVRRWAGLDAGSLRSERLGFRRHYRIQPWGRQVEVHWGELGQAYVTPVAHNEVCVVAITRHRGLNFNRILADLPWLYEKLSAGQMIGRDRGGVTTTRSLRRVVKGKIALIGDASGSADAITGEGLATAFREALLLGDALGRDAIAGYEAGHRDILHRPQTMASMMLAMDRSSWLRDFTVHTLSTDAKLFSHLLAAHTGEQSLVRLALTRGPRLALRLLANAINLTASRPGASQLSRPSHNAI